MSFKSQIKEDFKNCFLNTDEFGESITYTPQDGDPKTIKAVIVRDQIKPGGEDSGRTLNKQCEIYISNDADDGVATVGKGQDKATFPAVLGGSNVDWVVLGILGMSSGSWHLLLGK